MNKLIENYILLDRISASEFSEVYKCKHKTSNEFFAMKVVSFEKFITNPKYQEQLSNELHALKNFDNCPHIVKFVKLLKTKNNVYLVYEYCDGGTLEEYEKNNKITNENFALELLGQLVEGVSIVHSKKIVHGDLKPSNLVFKNGELKIVDFGFCKFLNGEKKNDLSKYFIGSPIYMAPELFENGETSEKSDTYAVGVIFYEMLFGKAPFEAMNIEDLVEKLRTSILHFPREINNISHDSEMILRGLLDRDPLHRLTIFDLKDWLMKKPKTSQDDMKEIKEMEKKNFNEYFEDKDLNLNIEFGKKDDILANVEQFVTFKNTEQMKNNIFTEMSALFMKKLLLSKKRILVLVSFLRTILELNIHESNVCLVLNLMKKIKLAYIDLILSLEKNFPIFFADVMKMPIDSVDPIFRDQIKNEETVKKFILTLVREEKKCEESIESYKNTLKYCFELSDYTNIILKEVNETHFEEQNFRKSWINYLKNLKEIANYFYMNCKNEMLLKEILIHGNLAFEILQESRNSNVYEEKMKEYTGFTIVNLHNLFEDKYEKFQKAEALKI